MRDFKKGQSQKTKRITFIAMIINATPNYCEWQKNVIISNSFVVDNLTIENLNLSKKIKWFQFK